MIAAKLKKKFINQVFLLHRRLVMKGQVKMKQDQNPNSSYCCHYQALPYRTMKLEIENPNTENNASRES